MSKQPATVRTHVTFRTKRFNHVEDVFMRGTVAGEADPVAPRTASESARS